MQQIDKRARTGLLWTLAVLMQTPLLLAAGQDQKLPDAERVIDRYIEVTGGKDAYLKINNRVIEGRLLMPAAGIEGKIKIYHSAPDKMRVLTELTGMGEVDEGYNGEIAWEVSTMMGARIKKDLEKAIVVRASDLHADLNWRKHYSDTKMLGVETVDGQEMFKLELTPEEGPPEVRYYAVDSGLLLKIETKVPTQMGELPVETSFEEYREVDGIKLPFKINQKVAMQQIEMNFSKIGQNVEIAPERFTPPSEVQALLSKEEAANPDSAQEPADVGESEPEESSP